MDKTMNEVMRKYAGYQHKAGEYRGIPIVHNYKDMFQYLEKFDGDIDMTLDDFERKWKLGKYSTIGQGD